MWPALLGFGTAAKSHPRHPDQQESGAQFTKNSQFQLNMEAFPAGDIVKWHESHEGLNERKPQKSVDLRQKCIFFVIKLQMAVDRILKSL